jgi:hypothetical protein
MILKAWMDLDSGKYIRYEIAHLVFFDSRFEYSSTIKMV